MKNTIISAALVALLPLAAFAAIAAEDEALVEVFAKGVGTTQDEAHKAADRAAVEQVVGTMVDATTLVKNDELVEDKILTYSAALIADSKIVGTPRKSDDGLIVVKVLATVKKTALKEKLVATKLVTVELDGESLWAQAVSAQDNLSDAEAMIKDVLAQHIACIVAEPVPGKAGKSPLDFDAKTSEIFANVRVKIDMAKYRQFAKEVVEKLSPMAERRFVLQGVAEGSSIDFSMRGFKESDDMPQPLLVLQNAKGSNTQCLILDANKSAVIERYFKKGALAVSVVLVDASGLELGSAIAPIVEDGDNSDFWEHNWASLCWPQAYPFQPSVIAPFFGNSASSLNSGEDYNAEISLYGHGSGKGYGFISERTFRVSLGKFTPDELKAATKLEIKIGHMKDGQFME